MSNLATDNEFIYTKRQNREDCRSAWKHPPPQTVMDRWVRCHVVGDKVVLGPVLKETLSSTSRAALERMAEKEIFGKGVGVHEKRERAPNFFDIYAEQSRRIVKLEQAIRHLLYSHKDGFHGCCWCGVGVGEVHTDECRNRKAHQLITVHDGLPEKENES